MADDELMQLRVSSEPYAKNGEIDAFLEIWGRNILRMEMEPLHGQPLHVDLLLRSLPGFALASGSASPMRNRHTAELADNDDVVLVVIADGAGEVKQHGRTAMIENGDAVLTANGAPADFALLSPMRVINYRLSRELLRPRVGNLDDLVARPITKNNPVLRLLAGYASVLNDQKELATAEIRHAVSTHMHELAALLLGGGSEAHFPDGVRAARLVAIKRDVIANLGDSSLSLTAVAARHGITPRYVNMLFEREGTTFTAFVIEQRLARAYAMLADPRTLTQKISAISHDCGFHDLSWFHRTFRRRYGATPSDIREAALKALKDTH
jgi:AraC-like DNA-binding protein